MSFVTCVLFVTEAYVLNKHCNSDSLRVPGRLQVAKSTARDTIYGGKN